MISVKSLMRTAKERGGRSIGLAEVMVLEYNGKKKNSAFKLNIQRLYDKSIHFTEDHSDQMLNDEANHYNNGSEDISQLLIDENVSEHPLT